MKSRTMIYSKLNIAILIFSLLIFCIMSLSYAEPIEESDPNLPHIDMKVISQKNGDTNQIIVECWASNLKSFEGADIVFSYDTEKLTPSSIEDNVKLTEQELGLISYSARPTSSTSAQKAFDNASKSILLKTFEFTNEYSSLLGVDVFRMLAPVENTNVVQFVMSNKDYETDISTQDDKAVLLGRFSFNLADEKEIEENEFVANRIKIVCLDDSEEEGIVSYIRDAKNEEDCSELLTFTYEKYGSITGKVITGYYEAQTVSGKKEAVYTQTGKNLAEACLYKLEDVQSINWDLTGNFKKITAERVQLSMDRQKISPIAKEPFYCDYFRTVSKDQAEIQPVKIVNTDEQGNFLIENILFGDYVLLIDKPDFADYVIYLTIDRNEKDRDIGDIKLVAGDFDKDGFLTDDDKTIYLRLVQKMQDKDNQTVLNRLDMFDLDDDQTPRKYNGDKTIMLRSIASGMKGQEIKTVIHLD